MKIAHTETFLDFYGADWKNLFLLGVIMVSAITVFIGILKPLLFNRIKWKPLRKSCLAFTNVALCFASVAVTFYFKKFDFSLYLHSAIATSALSIISYWFYENTHLRTGIHALGMFTLKKVYNVFTKFFSEGDVEELKNEITVAFDEIKDNAKKEIKSTAKKKKTDNELKNL